MNINRYIVLLIALLTSFSLAHAQYDSWTYVRALPESEIEDFEPLSENEIVALSNGIIYYSDNLGATWDLLIETEGDPINSMKSDAEGNFYYKNNAGLHKTRIGGSTEILKNGFGTFKLAELKGDTIFMFNGSSFHYSLNSGQSWKSSSYHSFYANAEFSLTNDALYFNQQFGNIFKYEIESDEFIRVYVGDSNTDYLRQGIVAIDDNKIFVSNMINDFEFIQRYYLSDNKGLTFDEIESQGLTSYSTTATFNGVKNDLIKFGIKDPVSGQAELIIFYSFDDGLTWSEAAVGNTESSISHAFYYNQNCPYAFIISENGRLFRTSGYVTNTEELDLTQPSLKASPNPSLNKFRIEGLNFPIAREVNIYDSSGAKVISHQNFFLNQEINLSNYRSGTYYIHILGKNGKKYNTTVLKQ